jgi:hypothetical protein
MSNVQEVNINDLQNQMRRFMFHIDSEMLFLLLRRIALILCPYLHSDRSSSCSRHVSDRLQGDDTPFPNLANPW